MCASTEKWYYVPSNTVVKLLNMAMLVDSNGTKTYTLSSDYIPSFQKTKRAKTADAAAAAVAAAAAAQGAKSELVFSSSSSSAASYPVSETDNDSHIGICSGPATSALFSRHTFLGEVASSTVGPGATMVVGVVEGAFTKLVASAAASWTTGRR